MLRSYRLTHSLNTCYTTICSLICVSVELSQSEIYTNSIDYFLTQLFTSVDLLLCSGEAFNYLTEQYLPLTWFYNLQISLSPYLYIKQQLQELSEFCQNGELVYIA